MHYVDDDDDHEDEHDHYVDDDNDTDHDDEPGHNIDDNFHKSWSAAQLSNLAENDF